MRSIVCSAKSRRRRATYFVLGIALCLLSGFHELPGQEKSSPLVLGETFQLDSTVLREKRRINIYLPPGYADSPDTRFPVLYMPDGGLGEDFLHIAGLVQISVTNGTMRPFLLVGIENTQRRRDLTGPTEDDDDKKIATIVGGSREFRDFIRDELKPQINARYRTNDESAIVGESLAGLLVVETFLLEPDLFDTYIAIDPSLWWNRHALIECAADRLSALPDSKIAIYLANSNEPELAKSAQRFSEILQQHAPKHCRWHYESMPDEKHSTVFHPAALEAFRRMLGPAADVSE